MSYQRYAYIKDFLEGRELPLELSKKTKQAIIRDAERTYTMMNNKLYKRKPIVGTMETVPTKEAVGVPPHLWEKDIHYNTVQVNNIYKSETIY